MGAPSLPAAFFVSQTVTEREVRLADGSVHKLQFREPSAKTLRRYYSAAAELKTDPDGFDAASAELIASSLVDDDGNPVLTVEQARTLTFEVQVQMLNAIREGPPKGKPSSGGPKTGIGTSSRKGSAGAASLNGRRRSRKASSSDGSSSINSRDG